MIKLKKKLIVDKNNHFSYDILTCHLIFFPSGFYEVKQKRDELQCGEWVEFLIRTVYSAKEL